MKIFTGENFDMEVLGASVPVMVEFSAAWCGPCKIMAPVLEKISEEYEGRAVVGKVDIEESGEVAARYGIMGVPTILVFKNGAVVGKLNGYQSLNDMKKAMDAVL